MSHVCEQGVYYGFAQVDAVDPEDGAVHPMVMSLGWNPFYKNEKLSAVSQSTRTSSKTLVDFSRV